MKYYIHVPKNEITGKIKRGYKPGQHKICTNTRYPIQGEPSAAEQLKMQILRDKQKEYDD